MARIIPAFADSPSNSHMNILRYVNGVDARERRKEMRRQLKNLIAVNDFYTLPFREKKSVFGKKRSH